MAVVYTKKDQGLTYTVGTGSPTHSGNTADQYIDTLTAVNYVYISGWKAFALSGSSGVDALTAGTGLSANTTTGSVTIINTSPDQTVTLSGGTGITTGGSYPNFTITNSSPASSVTLTSAGGTVSLVNDGTGPALANKGLTSGTGISLTDGGTQVTITNNSPDQTVVLNNGSNISVTGAYPNFTITATGLLQATGNTSASCITNLYVDNLFGCSPITVHDNIQSSGSTASGLLSFAFGYQNTSIGDYSHAEGFKTTASGTSSHAEGYFTTAGGQYSHAEGWSTKALGAQSHSEGIFTTAIGNYSHAEGQSTTSFGPNSHAEGQNTKSIGNVSHAEGNGTIASGTSSHAEGTNTISVGSSSHAEGFQTTAQGTYSHAEGNTTKANGNVSHAEGQLSIANGNFSHVGGYSSRTESDYSIVFGDTCAVDSTGSWNNILSGFDNEIKSTAGGENCIIAGYNNEIIIGGDHRALGIGGYISGGSGNVTFGQGAITRSDINLGSKQILFGDGVANKGSVGKANTILFDVFNGSGYWDGTADVGPADYAEYFEWSDNNTSNEDRVGYFVSLIDGGEKIEISNNNILGIVSAKPAIVGDSAFHNWKDKYLKDEWGRDIIDYYDMYSIFEENEIEPGILKKINIKIYISSDGVIYSELPNVVNLDGTIYNGDTSNKIFVSKWPNKRVNPNYDPNQQYISRQNRPEWSPIGLLGKLRVRTAEPITGSTISVNQNGMAINGTDYSVLEKIKEYDGDYGIVKIFYYKK
jgi:hypothetical protein